MGIREDDKVWQHIDDGEVGVVDNAVDQTDQKEEKKDSFVPDS
jgi:hypothetical protein